MQFGAGVYGGGFTVALDFSAGRINFIVNRGAEQKLEGSRLNAATSKPAFLRYGGNCI